MARRRVVQDTTVSTFSTVGAPTGPGGVDSRNLSGMGHRQRQLTTGLLDLLDVISPRDCVGCTRPGRLLCADCSRALDVAPFLVDRIDPPAVAAGWLDGVLGAVVRGYKSGAGRTLVGPLSERLVAVLAHALLAHPLLADPLLADGQGGSRPRAIVPVPPSLLARWTRGEDIWGRVVQRAVMRMQRSGAPLVYLPILEPVRRVRDQRHLGAQERAMNLIGSLRVRDRMLPADPARYDWIIADDVLTTGATLREAARALENVVPTERLRGAVVIAVTR